MRTWNTDEFVATWGVKPRGYGSWAFAPADHVWPGSDMPSDAIAWSCGLYSDAKREVAAGYPLVKEWIVLP